jgi:hypothetical protein
MKGAQSSWEKKSFAVGVTKEGGKKQNRRRGKKP